MQICRTAIEKVKKNADRPCSYFLGIENEANQTISRWLPKDNTFRKESFKNDIW